jgi:hypothetical protein
MAQHSSGRRVRACDAGFLRELDKQILRGIRPADPILKTFKGTPEQASASFCGAVLRSDRAVVAQGLLTKRFIG